MTMTTGAVVEAGAGSSASVSIASLTSSELCMGANALRIRAGEVEDYASMGRYADTLRKVARALDALAEAESAHIEMERAS